MGTSRFEHKGLTLEDISLLPPIKALADSDLIDVEVNQYYFDHPLFDSYERGTGSTDWDLQALASLVTPGARVLDIGCGAGRALLHMAAATELAAGVGVDTSKVALDQLRAAVAADPHLSARVTAHEADILGDLPAELSGAFDLAVLADCTVNFLTDETGLEQLLRQVRGVLAGAESRLALAVFDDAGPQGLAGIDGRVVSRAFTDDDGIPHVIWWSNAFDRDTETLHRSVFVQKHGLDESGRLQAVVCDLYDRLWTPATMRPVYESLGFKEAARIPSAVVNGAASGLATCVLVLEQA